MGSSTGMATGIKLPFRPQSNKTHTGKRQTLANSFKADTTMCLPLKQHANESPDENWIILTLYRLVQENNCALTADSLRKTSGNSKDSLVDNKHK